MTRRPPKVCTSPNAEALIGEFVYLGIAAHIYALAGKVSCANDNTRWPPRDDCGEGSDALPAFPASVDLNPLHDTRGDRAERFCVVGVDNLLHSETTATGAQT